MLGIINQVRKLSRVMTQAKRKKQKQNNPEANMLGNKDKRNEIT